MHDRLDKRDFMERHVAHLLREGRSAPRPNRRFGIRDRESSPIRQFVRRRFRESVAKMISGVYRTENVLPEEHI